MLGSLAEQVQPCSQALDFISSHHCQFVLCFLLVVEDELSCSCLHSCLLPPAASTPLSWKFIPLELKGRKNPFHRLLWSWRLITPTEKQRVHLYILTAAHLLGTFLGTHFLSVFMLNIFSEPLNWNFPPSIPIIPRFDLFHNVPDILNFCIRNFLDLPFSLTD